MLPCYWRYRHRCKSNFPKLLSIEGIRTQVSCANFRHQRDKDTFGCYSLQGGITSEYYHLTSSEYSALNPLGKFIDGTNPLNAVYLEGNVGIGRTPGYKFDVSSVNEIARFTATGTSVNPDVLIIDADSSNSRAALQVQGSNGAIEVLFVASGGNIGIRTTAPNSTLQTNGSVSSSYITKTATYTITSDDYTINCTANTFTTTLPTAVGITGRIYNIKNSGTGTITIAANGTETIDGSLTAIIATQYNSITIQSTGTNWIII